MAKGEKTKRPKKSVAAKSVSKPKKITKKQAPKLISHIHPRLPSSLRLGWQALQIINVFKKPIAGIFLIYLGLNLLLASGVSIISSNISVLKEEVANTDKLGQALSDFGSLTGGAGWSSDQASSALQTILFIIGSLAIIWALRQLVAGEKISVKQSYYQSTGQLIPFTLLIFVIILQLLPMTIGAAVLGIVATGAFGAIATVIFATLFLLLTTWSLYMLSCSVIALYIVTLPHMHPRQALRSAKKLVSNRRFAVMRRLIFLPFLMMAGLAVIFLPILLIFPPLAAPLFFMAATFSVFAAHIYLYNLYRRLLA